MKTNNRKQVRLANYDYSLPGGYYITICTHERKQLLSEVICVNEKAGPFVKLSEIGQIADEVLHEMSEQQGMRPDTWVIMPDHIHIIVLKDAAFADTLGQFVGKFKSIVSNQWLKQCKSRGVQRGRYGKETITITYCAMKQTILKRRCTWKEILRDGTVSNCGDWATARVAPTRRKENIGKKTKFVQQ